MFCTHFGRVLRRCLSVTCWSYWGFHLFCVQNNVAVRVVGELDIPWGIDLFFISVAVGHVVVFDFTVTGDFDVWLGCWCGMLITFLSFSESMKKCLMLRDHFPVGFRGNDLCSSNLGDGVVFRIIGQCGFVCPSLLYQDIISWYQRLCLACCFLSATSLALSLHVLPVFRTSSSLTSGVCCQA